MMCRPQSCRVDAIGINVSGIEEEGALEWIVEAQWEGLFGVKGGLPATGLCFFFFYLFQRVSGGIAAAVEDIYRVVDVVVVSSQGSLDNEWLHPPRSPLKPEARDDSRSAKAGWGKLWFRARGLRSRSL